ncbi:hypothetical protein AB0O01_09700 [Streptomyces sp. NPDC093252]|uniref:hypothetical protein n=1 Tax=Streptomyces sp. NPDC093252 TaxID=3154980 RepID=UPI003428C190
MSIVGLNRLARDLEHVPGLLDRFREAPQPVLRTYDLSEDEKRAVSSTDATWLLAHGMNPVALRNLMVVLGIAHHAMYPSRRTED